MTMIEVGFLRQEKSTILSGLSTESEEDIERSLANNMKLKN